MADGSRRFDGYIRVSRRLGREGASYISPRVQREAIKRWADYTATTIDQFHVDEDESGGTQDRPGLREAIRRVEDGETNGIACWKLSRFGRNVAGALDDIQRVRAAGGDVVFTEEQIDTSGPFGQFILTVMFAVVTLERDNLTQGFEIAKTQAFSRGAFISRTPFGYQRTEDSLLEPDSAQAPHVTEAYRLAASAGLPNAVEYLRKNAPDARRWTTSTVRRMLAKRTYLGEQHNGTRVSRDSHEPLVSLAIWTAAQSGPLPRGRNAHYPLTRLAVCGTCGGPMIGGRGGTGQRTYRCSATRGESVRNGPKCPRGAVITASIIEEHVVAITRELLSGMTAVVTNPDTDRLAILERGMLDAEAELEAFAADLTLRRALGDRYHQHLQSRVEAVEKARDGYREAAREAQPRLELSVLDVDDERMLPALLRSIFDSILVRPGRGPVAERVRLVPHDLDGTAGIVGAEDP